MQVSPRTAAYKAHSESAIDVTGDNVGFKLGRMVDRACNDRSSVSTELALAASLRTWRDKQRRNACDHKI